MKPPNRGDSDNLARTTTTDSSAATVDQDDDDDDDGEEPDYTRGRSDSQGGADEMDFDQEV